MILVMIHQKHVFPFLFTGQKTLLSCLYDFLKQEKLEGDNQYYCNGCESKQGTIHILRKHFGGGEVKIYLFHKKIFTLLL